MANLSFARNFIFSNEKHAAIIQAHYENNFLLQHRKRKNRVRAKLKRPSGLGFIIST